MQKTLNLKLESIMYKTQTAFSMKPNWTFTKPQKLPIVTLGYYIWHYGQLNSILNTSLYLHFESKHVHTYTNFATNE